MNYKGLCQKGVTLMELMIVVAIVAILAAVALPSYEKYVLESRRTEAKAELMSAQLLLEEFRISCLEYGQKISDCSTIEDEEIASILGAQSDYYNFSLSEPASTSYTLTATAIGNQLKDQEGDDVCSPLTVNQSDERKPIACW